MEYFSINVIDTVQSLNGPSSLIFELITLLKFHSFNLVGPINNGAITYQTVFDSLDLQLCEFIPYWMKIIHLKFHSNTMICTIEL